MSKKLNVSKEEMYSEMVKSMWMGNPTNKLVEIFQLMTEKLAQQFIYVVEEDRNDVIAFTIAGLLERYYKYDFNLKNPFSYFTSIIKNLIINNFKHLERASVSIDAIITSHTENLNNRK